jgi:hypothetical protein
MPESLSLILESSRLVLVLNECSLKDSFYDHKLEVDYVFVCIVSTVVLAKEWQFKTNYLFFLSQVPGQFPC